jgi:hypothetical protein
MHTEGDWTLVRSETRSTGAKENAPAVRPGRDVEESDLVDGDMERV